MSDPASPREVMCWVWPAGSRAVLSVAVLAAAVGLAVVSRSVPDRGGTVVKAPDLLLDLNTAPPAVLETLPHIGASLVRRIVAARESRPFASLSDVGRRVRGLGPVTLARIAPYLRFEPVAQPRLPGPEVALQDRPTADQRRQ